MSEQKLIKIQQYFEAFAKRDADAISRMLSAEVTLQDPIVGVVHGHDSVMSVYNDIFKGHSKIECQLINFFESSTGVCAAEFSLNLHSIKGEKIKVDGVDRIEFTGDKISNLRAYLDLKL